MTAKASSPPSTSAASSASAIDKRDHAAAPHVETLLRPKGSAFPAGRMLISSPLEINAVLARIPQGRVLTMSALRESLAKSHKADYTCPLTTGIFVRICAEAADAERALGKPGVPYWRVVRDDGSMIDKLPCGADQQARRLESEQVVLFRMQKKVIVSNLERFGWKAPPLGKKAAHKPS